MTKERTISKSLGIDVEKEERTAQGIIDILIQHKAINTAESKPLLKAFKESDKEAFSDFMREEGLIDDVNLLRAYSEYYQVPSFDVVGYFFDTELLQKFPKGFLLRNACIPLERDENILVVVASEPDNPDLLEKIGEYVSYDIRFRVGLRHDICDAVKEFYDSALTEEEFDQDLREQKNLLEQERLLEYEDDDDLFADLPRDEEIKEE